MPSFKELLEKIQDDDLKKQLETEYNTVNQKAGEHGRKLIEKDQELDTLRKSSKGASEYAKYFKMLEDEGMSPKDIPSVLEKMKIAKTAEDEAKVLKSLYDDAQKQLKDLNRKAKDREVRDVVDKHFTEARKNFKNEKGEALTILDDFIDNGKLYAEISDLGNEVLIKERVDTVLKDAFQKTEGIKQKLGFQGNTVHNSPEQKGVNNGPDVVSQLKKIADEDGHEAALSAFLNLQKQG